MKPFIVILHSIEECGAQGSEVGQHGDQHQDSTSHHHQLLPRQALDRRERPHEGPEGKPRLHQP